MSEYADAAEAEAEDADSAEVDEADVDLEAEDVAAKQADVQVEAVMAAVEELADLAKGEPLEKDVLTSFRMVQVMGSRNIRDPIFGQ